MYIVCLSVLSCSNLKLHQTLEAKNNFKQENVMLQLKFNPGLMSLMLTGFVDFFIFKTIAYTILNWSPVLNRNNARCK